MDLPRPRRSTETGTARPELDSAFAAFLFDRLSEEILAATHRRIAGTSAGPATDRALNLLGALVSDLERGALPSGSDLMILTTVYAGHPDFRSSWARHP